LVAKIRSNISEKHDWKDVFASLNDAAEDYNNPKGIMVVHKWLREATGKAEIVEPFVGFIPDMEYTSVICAGLKFVIEVKSNCG
jgi:hypothetical protein